MKKVNKCHLS